MKLPESKKERIQTIALIAIGIIFVIYVGGSYAVKPILKNRTERLRKIEKIKSDIEMVENVIRLVKMGRQVNNKVVAEIVQITETSNYVMKARLGNYLIGATEKIEKAAKDADVKIESITEAGILNIPSSSKDGNPFQLYTVRVSIDGGIHDLVFLLKQIEASNPYLSISEIEITGNSSHADKHRIFFNVQWPIWQDENTISDIIKSGHTL
jgi:hypothetical protein